MKYTPGPWHVAPFNGGLHVWNAAGGVLVAHCGGLTLDEAKANARLIAAAPKLLAMLELLYAHCENALVNSDVILSEPGLRISLQQAREALCEASEEWEKA
jgi:hypothetical protein